MNPALERYAADFAAVRTDVASVVADLTEPELQWREREGRWSIVECLEHLNSGWTILPKLDRKIALARENGIAGVGPFRRTWFGRFYVRAVEPPVRFRVPAPRRFRPRREPPSADVVPRLLALQDEFAARVRSADGLDVGAILLSSPITHRLKLTLGEWFAFLAAHERRHLWQAANVRRLMGDR
jgi:hypothetical protein